MRKLSSALMPRGQQGKPCTLVVVSACRAADGSASASRLSDFVSRFACSARRSDGTSVRLPQLRRSLKPARLERHSGGLSHA